MKLKVSTGNSKMGNIQSVSLPSITTCVEGCECSSKCYANKLERLRPSVRDAYSSNYRLLKEDPNTYWREIEATIMLSRFFRFHVSGDIVDSEYFKNMISISARNPHCEILCFTKKYSIVNSYIESGGVIPDNLHIVFSAWRNFAMDNRYNLPEAHVRYKDNTTTASSDAVHCSGNCSECASSDGGCWSLKHGEQVVFDEH